MSVGSKVKAVSVTAAGAAIGAMAGGPIGLGVGGALGGVVDFIRHKRAKASFVLPPPGVVPGAAGGGLPPGANLAAASAATHLLLLGGAAERASAQVWLKQFQASVGLPQTGMLDPTTRAMLVTATAGGTYKASALPPVTILG